LSEKKAGKQIRLKLGEMRGKYIIMAPLSRFMEIVGYSGESAGPMRNGTSSTAMIQHAKRTFATVESDLPF